MTSRKETKADQNPNPENENENEEPKQEQKEEKLVIMKKGDYNVHVLIEEVKNLIEIEENQQPVPRVKIRVFNKDKRTAKMKKPCDSFVFNEHFYFDQTNLTAEMLDSEKILIEVFDNKHTDKKDYFGIYEFDFGYVYSQEDHALHNIWIGLANPESDNISKVRGYLKLSISVLNDSDSRVELEMKENEMSNCIVPAQIKMKYKQISFYFFRGEEFPDMDSVFSTKKVKRKCDGYIEVKYMGVTRKTKVVEMKNDVVEWNQIVDIPATLPAVSQKICMVVKDEDIGGDDIVGSIEVQVDDVFNGKYNNLQYLNIYGSPVNKKGGVYDQMNYNAEVGSRWNGRILMKCVVTDVDSPIARVTDIDEKICKEVYSMSRTNTWNIWVRVYAAFFLPQDVGNYAIRVSIQEKTQQTQSKKSENGEIDFSETLKLQLNTFSPDKFELPDLYIYLVDKSQSVEKENVCFQRIKADYFYLNKDIICIKLLPDPCIGKVKSMMRSGLLKCKICVYHIQNDAKSAPSLNIFEKGTSILTLNSGISSILGGGGGSKTIEVNNDDDDLEGLLGKNEEPVQQAPTIVSEGKIYHVVAIVYMSKGLVAAESDGTSDPFVVLQNGMDKKQTSVKNNTMNGIWNEKLIFDSVVMDLNDDTSWPVFLLAVFDYNKIKANVPLGYNYVWLNNASYSLNDPGLKEPKWHNLFLPKSNKMQGQILLSFYIFDEEHVSLMQNIQYTPETSLYHCEMNILGLRQLKPLGMIEVKKPFIKFDLNSLNVTGKPEDAHANIQTVPVSGGANPTINTVIKFDTKLPKNDIFMPELQCEVYDHMLSGLHNSLLGVFSIDIKKIIKKTHLQIMEDINIVRKKKGQSILQDLTADTFANFASNNSNINNNEIYEDNKLLPNDEENEINTTSKKAINYDDPLAVESKQPAQKVKEKENVLNISKTINQKEEDKNSDDDQFLEEDENKVQMDQEQQPINIDNLNLSNVEIAVPKPGERRLSVKGTLKVEGNFLKNNINNSELFVIYPNLKYYKIPGYNVKKEGVENEKIQKEFLMEDESKAPSKQLYFEIGYLLKIEENIKLEDYTKHYRRLYGMPLENVKCPEFDIKSPFNVGKIRRGKYIDKKSETNLFDAMKDVHGKVIHRYGNESLPEESRKSVGSESSQKGFMSKSDVDQKMYGKFKGLIRIAQKQEYSGYEQAVEMSRRRNSLVLKNSNKYENLREKLINKTSVIIRLYVLELNQLAKKDTFSESDPYIKILINNKEVINERQNHQDDQKNCKWYKYYDIAGEIPGSVNLKLEVWDWDEILADSLIGHTIIDLEDRFFNDDWQNLKYKPVEVRPLMHPDLNGKQGFAYIWLEIFDSSKRAENPVYKIDPQPICELECRLIVYETEDIEMMDVEGTSDIYVIAYVDQKELQKTDVHYRCQTGAGSFNWRMLLPLKIPIQKPCITLQVYDKDIFSSDDYICGTVLDMKNLINIPKYLDIPITLNKNYYNGLTVDEKKIFGDIEFLSHEDDPEGIKFWVQCYKGKKEASGQGEKAGRVLCSLEILPKKDADLSKVGKGREEPNVNPYLPPPTGRFKFSLNPFNMMNQCVGPKFRRKCYCYCLCALLLAYLIFALPTILTGIMF